MRNMQSEQPAVVDTPRAVNGGGAGPRLEKEQWDEMHEYEAQQIGIGVSSRIGVLSVVYDLGIQEGGEAVIPVTDSDYSDQEWRLEKGADGKQKDPTAYVEQRFFKRKKQDCLVYKRTDSPRMTVAVDFPEIMIDRSKWFEGSKPAPLRVILGENGFIPRQADGTIPHIIAYPWNMNHINVNAQSNNAAKHYALPKNGKLHELADLCGVLDSNGCFHNTELVKLVGKVAMFDVDAHWIEGVSKTTGNPYKIFSVDAKARGRLSPRDTKYFEEELEPLVPDSMLGYVSFNGVQSFTGKDEDVEYLLKSVRQTVINTMLRSKNFKDHYLFSQFQDPERPSPLYLQFKEKAPAKLGGSGSASNGGEANSGTTTQQATESDAQAGVNGGAYHQSASPATTLPEPAGSVMDFDDDIPF